MRINELFESELILESAIDQHQLEKISKGVVAHATKLIKNPSPGFIEFKLKDISMNLSHLNLRLRSVLVTFVNNNSDSKLGSYYYGKKDRSVVIPTAWADGAFIASTSTITSTVLHELRHALDDSLSDSAAFNKDQKTPYLQRPSEINARFSEVMGRLNGMFVDSVATGSTMSKKEYLNEFVDLSIDYNLLSDLDGNDELLKNFEDFVKRGIFGSKIKTSVFSRIVSSNPSKSPEYRTPFSNRKFKRLLLRLSKMYDLLELKHK